MRLAVEITTCTPLRTGVGYYAEHVVDALLETRRAGDEVVLLSNRPPAPELAERWAPHLHVSGPSVRAVWMQTAVPRLLADTGADLGVFPNYAAPLASPCPTLVVVHDLAVLRMPHFFTARKRFLSRPMMSLVMATAPVIGTVSETSQRDIVGLLGVRPERVALLPGAAHPSCRPASADQVASVRARHGLARPYVLTVGTLEPRKDLPTLLRAFDRLGTETDHDLVVVGGRGWKDGRLVRALESREGRHVRWLGYVPESDLAALYTGADLFVLAPTLEGFGLPLLEAMACGTPVIATDVAALREVGGDAAQFVPPATTRPSRAPSRSSSGTDAPPRTAGSAASGARSTSRGPGPPRRSGLALARRRRFVSDRSPAASKPGAHRRARPCRQPRRASERASGRCSRPSCMRTSSNPPFRSGKPSARRSGPCSTRRRCARSPPVRPSRRS